MNPMIELRGVVTDSCIYFLVPNSASYNGGVDLEKLEDLGFDCFLSFDNVNCKNNKIFVDCTGAKYPKIKILTESILSTVMPISNVEVEIVRRYTIFQWVGFSFICLHRKIKELLR